MMNLKQWAVGAVLAVSFLCSGCSPVVRESGVSAVHSGNETEFAYQDGQPVKIETLDSRGDTLTETFSKPPKRVVAVWQNSIETLLALGVGDRIVGAMGLPSHDYLRPQYREAYDRIPYTSMENLDVETILMQDPDFIVGWASTFGAKTLRGTDFWRSRGIHTYISPGSSPKVKDHTVEFEYQDILNMGLIFDRKEKAEEIVSRMQQEIQDAETQATAAGRHPRGLIIEYLGNNINVYGKGTLAGDILTKMGGELLAADTQQISKEQIVELDPDSIFVVVIESNYGNEDQILGQLYKEKAFKNLKAVKEHRIYALPLYAIYSAGVRTYDGIQIIGKGLYGE